jgi:predicted transcriptional regulator
MTETSTSWQRRERSRDLTGLGRLEAEIMRVVWDKGEVTVRDVYEELRLRRRIAYTTVMSVLRNLHTKGLVAQDRSATAYVYRATVSDRDVAFGILQTVVETIMGGETAPLIEYLNKYGS